MKDPNIVYSGLNESFVLEGQQFEVIIIRLEHENLWALEVVDQEGASTVWDEQFESDQAAYDFLQSAIEEEGIQAIIGSDNVVQFPRRN